MGYHVEQPVRIPAEARDFEGFRRWARSRRFPKHGQITYVGGDIEVDMSPEDLLRHGTVKAEIGVELYIQIARRNLGNVYIDKALVSFPAAALSVEPDVVVVLYSSLDAGRVREIPRKKQEAESFIELEGAVDLVVEVVSDSSVGKDRRLLPPRYAAAGVPELWLVDVRRKMRFEIFVLSEGSYRLAAPDTDGWVSSPLLGQVRLRRERVRPDRWNYRLDVGNTNG